MNDIKLKGNTNYLTMDDYLQLHILFCNVKKHLEDEFLPKIRKEEFQSFFVDYDKLNTSPLHVFKKLNEQKRAVFALGKCITNFMNYVSDNGLKPYNFNIKKETGKALTTQKFIEYTV